MKTIEENLPVIQRKHDNCGTAKRKNEAGEGLVWERVFSRPDVSPFDEVEWEQRSVEVRSRPLNGQHARAYARMFFGNAERVDLDGQGRLVIPQKLRSTVGIAREVLVIGVSDRLEIWSRETWDRYEHSHGGAYASGALDPDA